ncbi:PhlD [Streptomyces xiamenensis]|uniref:PhlD n=1 Tax=Streptomyces xiamenensis TaxID=408015 RepID=UPI0036E6B404
MSVTISAPIVRLAPHWVETVEIEADLHARHPGHPRLGVWLRMLRRSGVVRRPWIAPLPEVTAVRGAGERTRAAYAGARDLAVTAAQDALAAAGLEPAAVDCVVTTHTTSWTVPGLDVDLVGRLGLRPDVSRIGLATVACAGGAHALLQAVRFVRARPGSRVLVVAAEALSTLYRPQELSLQNVLYGGLFGDSAAAAIVASSEVEAGGRAVEVVDDWELVLPDSADAYWGVLDGEGVLFDSGASAKSAVGRVQPYLTGWLANRPVRWAVVHPGGPGIITTTLTALGLDPETAGEHSLSSLSCGNLGGAAVLDVLARTTAAGTPPGDGLLIAYGPGFTATALRVRPHAPR